MRVERGRNFFAHCRLIFAFLISRIFSTLRYFVELLLQIGRENRSTKIKYGTLGAPYICVHRTHIWILLRGVDCSVILLTIIPSWYDAVGSFSVAIWRNPVHLHIALLCVREIGVLASYPNAFVSAARVYCPGEDRRAYLVSAMSDCNGVRVRAIREIYRYMSDRIAQSTFVKRYILLH